jgi:hypothetical protein
MDIQVCRQTGLTPSDGGLAENGISLDSNATDNPFANDECEN